MTRPARVVIDFSALQHNLNRVRELAPASKVMAIVKADAYGHGVVRVAKALTTADAFGVACLEEAEQLRYAGIWQPIVLLEGHYSVGELKRIQQLDLDIVVHHSHQIDMLEQTSLIAPVRIWLKVRSSAVLVGMAALLFFTAGCPAKVPPQPSDTRAQSSAKQHSESCSAFDFGEEECTAGKVARGAKKVAKYAVVYPVAIGVGVLFAYVEHLASSSRRDSQDWGRGFRRRRNVRPRAVRGEVVQLLAEGRGQRCVGRSTYQAVRHGRQPLA